MHLSPISPGERGQRLEMEELKTKKQPKKRAWKKKYRLMSRHGLKSKPVNVARVRPAANAAPCFGCIMLPWRVKRAIASIFPASLSAMLAVILILLASMRPACATRLVLYVLLLLAFKRKFFKNGLICKCNYRYVSSSKIEKKNVRLIRWIDIGIGIGRPD